MLAIVADNTKNLKRTTPSKPGTFRTRKAAQNAAVRTIGPHARDGFEYVTSKCDGAWLWLGIGVEDRKPESEAQIKANGGKRSVLSLPDGAAAAYAAAEFATKPKDDLDIPGFLRRAAKPVTPPSPSVIAEAMVAAEVQGQMISPSAVVEALATPPQVKAKATAKSETKSMPKKTKPEVKARKDTLKPGSKSAILIDTVCRKGGATNAQLCEAVGWAQCLPALKKAATAAGVEITTRKEKGQPTVYIGTRA